MFMYGEFFSGLKKVVRKKVNVVVVVAMRLIV